MWVSRRSVAPTEPVRETASMTGEYTQTDRFRGSRIHLCDLAGLEIRDCEVSGLKIVDCYGGDVYLGGDFERLVVNDVDVTMYVEAQLDRQHPARVLARDAASPDDYRAAWDAMETLWQATLDRARLLHEAKLHERVDGEWSVVETRRNDTCCSPAMPGSAMPCSRTKRFTIRWAFLPAGCLPMQQRSSGSISKPPRRSTRCSRRGSFAWPRCGASSRASRAAELDRTCGRKPAETYPDQEYVVRRCLRVVLKEEAEHHRYSLRDLAVLEAGERTE